MRLANSQPSRLSPYFTPQELAHALGVSISTVKRWADQGRFPVRRTEGGHRRIPRESALAFLQERGYGPEALLGQEAAAAIPEPEPAREDSEATLFFRLLTEGRERELLRQVRADLAQGDSLAALLDQAVAPALRRIGHLWQTGRTGIFTEHVAARLVSRALDLLHQERPAPDPGAPLALVATPEDDGHGLPAAMAGGVLEEAGWQVVELGAYTPATVLADQGRTQGVTAVVLAMSRVAAPDLQTARLAELRRLLGRGPQLLAGGPALHEHPFPAPEGVALIETLPELRDRALSLRHPQG
jgi:excisionase family DNA binding protein